MKSLIVDDARVVRMALRGIMQQLGWQVVEAENGKQAMEQLQRNPDVALILLDWHMPVMSGIEVLQALKSDGRYNHIPISMVTVEIERNEIQKAIDMGATNYLIKPFSQERLIGKIIEGLKMEM